MLKKIDFKKIAIRGAGVAAGAFVGTKIDQPMAKIGMFEKKNNRAMAKIAAGALLPALLKGKMASTAENVGDGLIAAGVIQLLTKEGEQSFPVAGIYGDPVELLNEPVIVEDPMTELSGVMAGPGVMAGSDAYPDDDEANEWGQDY